MKKIKIKTNEELMQGIRLPMPPPSRKHKSKKDYKRNPKHPNKDKE